MCPTNRAVKNISHRHHRKATKSALFAICSIHSKTEHFSTCCINYPFNNQQLFVTIFSGVQNIFPSFAPNTITSRMTKDPASETADDISNTSFVTSMES
eukprot:979901-Ditylum_brightwellii.AAC.1